MDAENLPELLSRNEAAKWLRLTPQALSQMAIRKTGPKYVRLGRAIRYRKTDLADWLASRVIDPEASVGP